MKTKDRSPLRDLIVMTQNQEFAIVDSWEAAEIWLDQKQPEASGNGIEHEVFDDYFLITHRTEDRDFAVPDKTIKSFDF